jgi:2-iminobutanoate/2-iminopropanoate deaminase
MRCTLRSWVTPPARTTVCVSLWGVALEIDCIAERITVA